MLGRIVAPSTAFAALQLSLATVHVPTASVRACLHHCGAKRAETVVVLGIDPRSAASGIVHHTSVAGAHAVVRPRSNRVDARATPQADAVGPLLDSYRALLLPDGRVAVQVRVVDRRARIGFDTVLSVQSFDSERTATTAILTPILDDFGRAEWHEVVIGPFAPGRDVHLSVRAADADGEWVCGVPRDSWSVMQAGTGGERLFDALARLPIATSEGHPMFDPARMRRWRRAVESHRSSSGSGRSGGGTRRNLILGDELEVFAIAAGFDHGNSAVVLPYPPATLTESTPCSFIRIPPWR